MLKSFVEEHMRAAAGAVDASVAQKCANAAGKCTLGELRRSIGKMDQAELFRLTDERFLAELHAKAVQNGHKPYARLGKRARFLLERELEGFEEDIAKFGWDGLSAEEQAEIEYKRALLGSISDTHESVARSESIKAESARQWEEGQLNRGRKREVEDEDEYEYVFDDNQQVEFSQEPGLEEVDEPESEDQTEVARILPVVQHRAQLVELIRKNQIVVVAGETGSGKTTQLPQFLFEEGFAANGMIACTQPRRLAAMAVASRVAKEMKVSLGKEVGYTIRFDDKSSPATKIKYMTDGMLFREFLTDPDLSQYSVIIVDEAHERTLHTDVLLALLKDIAVARPELRIVISSATLNSEKMSHYFENAPVYTVPGRRYAVDIFYTKQPEANYVHAALMTIFQIHITEPLPGDILVFLPGQDEIEGMADNLLETKRKLGGAIKELIICPVYANMPPESQLQIFDPTPEGARKVVLATNIAETSLTINGIVYVIDSGFVKENNYNPRAGMDSLTVRECSHASANQRAGRAGRLAPGKCYRLYTKWTFQNELPKETTPEVLRTNLASVILLLLSLDVTNVLEFDFIDKPSTEAVVKSMELLYSLGAINSTTELTKIGRKMTEFPVDPMLAKTLLASDELHCSDQVITIVALLGELGSLFYRPKGKKLEADVAHKRFEQERGDHFTLLNVWEHCEAAGFSPQWCRDNFVQYRTIKRVREVRNQLLRLGVRVGMNIRGDFTDPAAIEKAFISGYFGNTARLNRAAKCYDCLRLRQSVYVHPSSALHDVRPAPELVLYHELVLTSREYMRGCMQVREEWVKQQTPHFYKSKMEPLKR